MSTATFNSRRGGMRLSAPTPQHRRFLPIACAPATSAQPQPGQLNSRAIRSEFHQTPLVECEGEKGRQESWVRKRAAHRLACWLPRKVTQVALGQTHGFEIRCWKPRVKQCWFGTSRTLRSTKRCRQQRIVCQSRRGVAVTRASRVRLAQRQSGVGVRFDGPCRPSLRSPPPSRSAAPRPRT